VRTCLLSVTCRAQDPPEDVTEEEMEQWQAQQEDKKERRERRQGTTWLAIRFVDWLVLVTRA
jgi:hypothetical protein